MSIIIEFPSAKKTRLSAGFAEQEYENAKLHQQRTLSGPMNCPRCQEAYRAASERWAAAFNLLMRVS